MSVASRLSPCCLLSLLFAIALFICTCCRDVSALFVYDCQTLLNIRVSEDELSGRHDLGTTRLQAFFPFWWIYRRICAVNQVLIPVRSASDDGESTEVCWSDSRLTWHPHVWRVLTMDVVFLLPGDHWRWEAGGSVLFSPARRDSQGNLLTVPSPPMQVQVRRGGVDSSNLHSLGRTAPLASEDHTLRLALINARLLANKTFFAKLLLHFTWAGFYVF